MHVITYIASGFFRDSSWYPQPAMNYVYLGQRDQADTSRSDFVHVANSKLILIRIVAGNLIGKSCQIESCLQVIYIDIVHQVSRVKHCLGQWR